MYFKNAPDTALVTFEQIESATKAFKSKTPIFDNRFVFITWYNLENNANTLQTSVSIEKPPLPQRKTVFLLNYFTKFLGLKNTSNK